MNVVDAATLRRSFLRDVAPLVQLRSNDAFVVTDIVRRLRRSGASTGAAEAAGALLHRLDRASFGETTAMDVATVATLQQEAQAVITQLRQEMSTRVRDRLRPVARSLALLCGTASLLSAQPAAFSRGTTAYESRRFTDAAVAFAEAASAYPTSAIAWRNLGAAHWMRADTAGAIVAWQRAARLAPHGTDARMQLQRHGLTGAMRTAIVPFTPDVAWLLLLGVTGVLSVVGASWRWRHRAISDTSLLGAAAIVAVFAALAGAAQWSADADRLVAIRRDVALRAEPVLAGEAGARARAGELAVVRATSDTWILIEVSMGRTGWVESEALRSLAAGDGRDVALAEMRFATDPSAP